MHCRKPPERKSGHCARRTVVLRVTRYFDAHLVVGATV